MSDAGSCLLARLMRILCCEDMSCALLSREGMADSDEHSVSLTCRSRVLRAAVVALSVLDIVFPFTGVREFPNSRPRW